MSTLAIPPTLPTAENAAGGILIVIGPGFGPETPATRRSFYSDVGIDKGPALNRFATWFEAWGLPLAQRRGSDTAFDRRFFTLQWPLEPIAPAHGPQQVALFAQRIDELVEVVKTRQPRLVLFLSCYLWHAVNTESGREALAPYWGQPKSEGRRLSSHRLGAFHQPWQGVDVIALPMPSKNTTDAFVQSLAQPMYRIFEEAGLLPATAADPLLQQARACLVIDRAATVQRLRTTLHVTPERANALFDSLADTLCDQDESGRWVLKK